MGGQFSVWEDKFDEEEQSGRPSTSRTDDHHAEVDALIKENRQIILK
jgi:hypothetical protein